MQASGLQPGNSTITSHHSKPLCGSVWVVWIYAGLCQFGQTCLKWPLCGSVGISKTAIQGDLPGLPVQLPTRGDILPCACGCSQSEYEKGRSKRPFAIMALLPCQTLPSQTEPNLT